MKNSSNNILGFHEIPLIPGITLPVLKGMKFVQKEANHVLEIPDQDLSVVAKLEHFNMQNYIIRRMRELISAHVTRVIGFKRWKLSVTSLPLDINKGVDIRVRENNSSLQYGDLTESIDGYRSKTDASKMSRDTKLIIYVPHKLTEYCYWRLLEKDYEAQDFDSILKSVLKDFQRSSRNGSSPSLRIYDPTNQIEEIIRLDKKPRNDF